MNRLLLIAVLLLVAMLTITVFAHAGMTDPNGGHYDRSTGEYHYHHGYPAHQHVNGKCPYDFDDKTGQNSGRSFGSTSSDSTETESTSVIETKLETSVEETVENNKQTSDKTMTVLVIILDIVVAYIASRLLLPALQDDDFTKAHPKMTPFMWIVCVPCWFASLPLLLIFFIAETAQRRYDNETERIRTQNKAALKAETEKLKSDNSKFLADLESLKTKEKSVDGLDELKRQNEELKKDSSLVCSNNKTLRQKIEDRDKKIDELNHELTVANLNIKQLSLELHQKENKLISLQKAQPNNNGSPAFDNLDVTYYQLRTAAKFLINEKHPQSKDDSFRISSFILRKLQHFSDEEDKIYHDLSTIYVSIANQYVFGNYVNEYNHVLGKKLETKEEFRTYLVLTAVFRYISETNGQPVPDNAYWLN